MLTIGYEYAKGRMWCAPRGDATGDLDLLEYLGCFRRQVNARRDVRVLALEGLDLRVLADLRKRTTKATGVKGGARYGE